MPAILVVDGYNAVNASADGKAAVKRDLKEARDYIVRVARAFAKRAGYIDQVKVVFDGDDKYRVLGSLSALGGAQIFSGTDKCDDEIIRIVKACSSRNRVIVVSDDNYVRNGCRPFASVIKCEELYKVKKDRRKKKIKGDGKNIPPELEETITREYREELGRGEVKKLRG